MASIILSFVGTQDPYSDRTNEEGSIVTLFKHLSEQKREIAHIFLIFTQDLQERAEITQQWLKEEAKITANIELIPVDPALSEDPIDIPLCTAAAKQALTLAKAHAAIGDTIAELRQKNLAALLKELYFGADIKIKNQNYSDFLTIVSQFQENFLRLLMVNIGLEPPIEYRDISSFWSKVRNFDNGNLYQQLVRENISTDGWVYVKAMSRIVEYTSQYTVLLQASAKLQAHCQDRNNYIHKLAGISQLDKSDVILNDLRNMLKQLAPIPAINTFDRLNQDILDCLKIDSSSQTHWLRLSCSVLYCH